MTSPEDPEFEDEDLEAMEAELELAAAEESGISLPAPSVSVPGRASAAAKATLGSGKRLAKRDWEECVVLWESGRYTLRELGDRYEIRPDTLQRRLKASGFEKGSRVTATEGLKPLSIEMAELTIQRIGGTKEQHYQYQNALAAYSTSSGHLFHEHPAGRSMNIRPPREWACGASPHC